MKNEPHRLEGKVVIVKNDDVNRALKKFKNKVEESGILKDLQKKEFFVTKGQQLRKDKAAGRMRYLKKLEKESLPKKMY